MAPSRPGYSSEMHRASMAEYRFPDGPAWRRD
jgi:L-fuconate dehydratase